MPAPGIGFWGRVTCTIIGQWAAIMTRISVKKKRVKEPNGCWALVDGLGGDGMGIGDWNGRVGFC